MKRKPILFCVILQLALQTGWADVPAGFSWVNLESDNATMNVVRKALHDPSITAIREVGVEDGFALMMTVSREAGAPTPDYDRWSICNVSLKTGMSRVLVSGYGAKLLDWIGANRDELAITYFDCWECEAATLFTSLRFKKGVGWRARWSNKTLDSAYPQPGAVALMADDDWDDLTGLTLSSPSFRSRMVVLGLESGCTRAFPRPERSMMTSSDTPSTPRRTRIVLKSWAGRLP